MSTDRSRIVNSGVTTSPEYRDLIENFIEFAFEGARANNVGSVRCPCRDCKNDSFYGQKQVREHLVCRGFDKKYMNWVWHGEDKGRDVVVEERVNEVANRVVDTALDHVDGWDEMAEYVAEAFEGKPEVLQSMIDDNETYLYHGSKHTVLSATLLLMNLKAKYGFTDKGMTDLLCLFGEMLPEGNKLPQSAYSAKKTLCPMGLELEKIHACPNDCMLYRGVFDKDLDKCSVCGVSRYKAKTMCIEVGAEDVHRPKKPTPAKVMWYLPILPRIKRLFANKVDAKNMTWHKDRDRPDDDVIRHTSDGDQWKNFDNKYEEFKNEPRHLRLGLSTDGMNPFGNMSSTHSSWPVMVVIYNLPSWLMMKRKYVLLSLMISGPKQPGNDIDVYLAPLIDDLKKLWFEQNWVYDAYRDETFPLKGMLFCTINDFPALGNLGGCSVKGHYACPICEDNTHFEQLENGRKTVYQGHRRFLNKEHPWRKCKKLFNGKVEFGVAPVPLSGQAIWDKVKFLENDFGKNRKKTPIQGSWKKSSIFFQLPYWMHLDVRHCLDVMHIEKNICDSLLGTLLNTPGKTKDGLKARLDNLKLGVKETLGPIVRDGKTYLPPACYTMSCAEKKSFCDSLRGIKVPTGYSSNISTCVKDGELKLGALKSHDCHNLMQELNVIALRGTLPNHVRSCISRMCYFFKCICRKQISRCKLDELQEMVVDVLCRMEIYFPPSFFDIMVHLMVHLVREVKLCGPVFLRWMYPFERYMKIFKLFVKNRYRPDASIVQRYVAEESIEFCTAFLHLIDSVGVPTARHDGNVGGRPLRTRELLNPSLEDMNSAHLYVLRNHLEVRPYLDVHLAELAMKFPVMEPKDLDFEHIRTFSSWLNKYVDSGEHSDTVKWLARRPLETVSSFGGYDIGGYTFATKGVDNRNTTQNSGVTLFAEGLGERGSNDQHFGTITDIWELDYFVMKVVVFKCIWVDLRHGSKREPPGLVLVNRKKVGSKNDQFILAGQAKQVFYINDPSNKNWEFVLDGKSRLVGDECDSVGQTEAYEDMQFPVEKPNVAEDEASLTALLTRTDHEEGTWIDSSGKSTRRHGKRPRSGKPKKKKM